MTTDARPCVLVAEDYHDTREIVAEILDLAGWRVLHAASGTQALERVQHMRPDAVLLDMSLPGMDGYEVARRLRRDAGTSTIPIIAFTAHAMAADRARVMELGLDAVLIKPCEPEEIIKTVRQVLTRHK